MRLPEIHSGSNVNPEGTGANTIMELTTGDLPGIMKCIFSWIEPQRIATVGETPVTLASMSDQPELAIIYANANKESVDWFVAEYITNTNNNSDMVSLFGLKPGGGLRIWRVKMDYSFFTGAFTDYKSPYTYIDTVRPVGAKDHFFYNGDAFTPFTALSSDYPKSLITGMGGGMVIPDELTRSGVYIENIRIGVDKVGFTVTITDENSILPERLSVVPKMITLDAGETQQLAATITPNNAVGKTIVWKSNDKTVAAVDNSGLIMAISPGTATITATVGDGKTDTCSVTVSPTAEPLWTYPNPNGNLR
jgi:uncharacterized protein YjdB